MKNLYIFIIALLALCGFAVPPAMADNVVATGGPVSTETSALLDCNYILEVPYTVFTNATGGAAESVDLLTFDLDADESMSIELMRVTIPEKFDDSTATNAFSLTLVVTDGTTTMQASTDVGADSGTVHMVDGTVAPKVFTGGSADAVYVTFDPGAGTSMSEMTQGKARFFFQVHSSREP